MTFGHLRHEQENFDEHTRVIVEHEGTDHVQSIANRSSKSISIAQNCFIAFSRIEGDAQPRTPSRILEHTGLVSVAQTEIDLF